MPARPDLRDLSEPERGQMREWLDNWRVAGAVLQVERMERLRGLTNTEAARLACDLWMLARPGGGDDAEGLLGLKRILRKLEAAL